MPPSFEVLLRSYAEVIVRVGLNLGAGQRLLIADPYELQGVAPGAGDLVAAVETAARSAGADAVRVIWGDEARLRRAARDGPGWLFRARLRRNTSRMLRHAEHGDALLFLQGSHPRLLADLPAAGVARLRQRTAALFGVMAAQLTAGATNWTLAAAPTPAWADAVYPDLPAEQRLPALWAALFEACRAPAPDPLRAWSEHLAGLERRREELNARRPATVRFRGPGTDLTVALPREHVWCTARLATRGGRPFVANLPTEEVFTLPHKDSAEGTVRVGRPVTCGGAVVDGIELEFHRGGVTRARARTGEEFLHRLLAIDAGAARLGEVALVPEATSIARTGRLFHHPLLDENACSHIALGEAYGFTLRMPDATVFNRSLIHVDLPLDPACEVGFA
ncbi:MAG TPA: aminopeptidase [Opitutaceae bacterium]|nr:aminopeptidase [Opitutaceae bacterium]